MNKSSFTVNYMWGQTGQNVIFPFQFYLEPPNRVKEEMEKRRLNPNSFVSLHHGETWIVGEHRQESLFMGCSKMVISVFFRNHLCPCIWLSILY